MDVEDKDPEGEDYELLQLRWNIDRMRGDAYACMVVFFGMIPIFSIIAQYKDKATNKVFILQMLLAAIILATWSMWRYLLGKAHREYTRHFNLSGSPDPHSTGTIFDFPFQKRVLNASLSVAVLNILLSWALRYL